MKRTYVIHPGPVGDEAEADQHASAATCPRCGRLTESNLPGKPPMQFVCRVQRRCADCRVVIIFDYLAGREYDGQLKPRFALAASPWPSLVLAPQVLAARFERNVAELAEIEAEEAKDDATASENRQFAVHAAADALNALWELEKLPAAPAVHRPPASTPIEQRLAQTFVSKGGRVPPDLRERFERAQSGDRPPPPLTPEGCMLVWFQDPKAFEQVAPPGVAAEDVPHVRLGLRNVLRELQRRYQERVAAAEKLPRIDTPPPSPVALAYAIDLVALLNTLLREVHTDPVRRAEKYEFAARDRIRQYFDLLDRYQSALDRAARVVEALERDGTAELVARSAWAGPYDILREAAAEACAWPLDGQSLTRIPERELALQGLQKVFDAAARSGAGDPRRAMEAGLKAVP